MFTQVLEDKNSCLKFLEKISNLKKIQDNKKLNFDIEVDGGINFENNKKDY